MKGDFTRFSHNPAKHYTRVLKQQGRVDLDADWNEAIEIFTRLERTEAVDVIGRCGVPEHSNGFKVEPSGDGTNLEISRGRIYVNGILCSNEADPDTVDAGQSVLITGQTEFLPGYVLPEDDGVYLAYVDVWERHITSIEDPEIREVALGGPDTTTRTQAVCQVKLEPLGEGELEELDCMPYGPLPNTGRLSARTEEDEIALKPCVVPASGGYRGLENRLYRVEIHDDGRDEDGNQVRLPTFKWSRDNGSVVLPIAKDGIDGTDVTLKRFGLDEVLTVKVGDIVEVSGDGTELYGLHGTLTEIVPDGIDGANMEISLSRDVSAHRNESHLKVRRWDHHQTDAVSLQDGALPVQEEWFELEDGVQVRFDTTAAYQVGDYWLIPARSRQGTLLWPQEGGTAAALPRMGIEHQYCTLALLLREGGLWTEARDCRKLFPSLTEIGDGSCCIRVMPGEDIQQAVDTVIGAGGGCIALCQGIHIVNGPLRISDACDLKLQGRGTSTVVRFMADDNGEGGLVIENGRRVTIEEMFMTGDTVRSMVTVRHDEEWNLNRTITFQGLSILNLTPSDGKTFQSCGLRLSHTQGIRIGNCRIAAETGIISLWGESLSSVNPEDGGGAEPAVVLSFDELTPGNQYRVGDQFSEFGVDVTMEPFFRGDGQSVDSGQATVVNSSQPGDSGLELATDNINLHFAPPTPYSDVRINFVAFGGNINLRVNGELLNVQSAASLEGTIGGVKVTVTFAADSQQRGIIELTQDTQPIASFALGGQEFRVDTVAFRGPVDTFDLNYGAGVSHLNMEDTIIRYRSCGVLAATSKYWTMTGCNIQLCPVEVIAELNERFKDVLSRQEYAQVLAGLEIAWHTAGTAPERSAAVLAFLWQDSAIRNCVLAGGQGIHAFWWVRGIVSETRITAHGTGFFAFWLHDSVLSNNRIYAAEGSGLVFAGTYRTRIDGNQLHGFIGVSNISYASALNSLFLLQQGLLLGYGKTGGLDVLTVFWIMLEESVDLMGLRELMDAVQETFADRLKNMPVTLFIAYAAGTMFSNQMAVDNEKGVALPVINLQMRGNEFTCSTRGISLRNYIPLGSLRILENRISTVKGQAVLVEAYRFATNAHLVVFLYRTGFKYVLKAFETDGEMPLLRRAIRKLAQRWQAGSENFLELDFRIEGNTIHSLRTAIESNLFELAIVGNHITMQERSLAKPRENATISGTVNDTEGTPIQGAVVLVVGTERAVSTTEDGRYMLAGLSAGTYTLQARRWSYSAVTTEVTVGEGEEEEVNFTLEEYGFWADHLSHYTANYSMSTPLLVEGMLMTRASNPEISRITDILEKSDAFEPFAVALREGSYTHPVHYSEYLLKGDGPLNTTDERNAAADAVSSIRGLTSDKALEQVCGRLNTALRANDRTTLMALMVGFVRGILGYVDSQGILVKGVGCRINENQVLVPADVQSETQALGGIQISVDFGDLFLTVMMATFLQQKVLQQEDEQVSAFDPLLGVTDTLVDNNEVIGGIGHGISVQGIVGRPDYVQDLQIRGNQVRGMAGSGIYCNEYAFIVGLNIDGNHISQCGRTAGFTAVKGGVVIHSAALCHLHANQIVRCGEEVTGSAVQGVDLESIYGLHFIANQVLANGSAQGLLDDCGLRLQEVYGTNTIHDNVFSFNRGTGLNWINSAQAGEDALLSDLLLQALNQCLGTSTKGDQLVQEEQASLQNNVFKSTDNANLPLLKLLNISEVKFSGNSCYARTSYASVGEVEKVNRAIVSNNLFNTNSEVALLIRKADACTILGNNGSKAIEVAASGQVEHGFNIPAVIL